VIQGCEGHRRSHQKTFREAPEKAALKLQVFEISESG
jgi:hypothetical protein